MSDRYPGTTSPAIERRFKALQDQINRLQKGSAQDTARTRQQVNVAATDLTNHVEAANPHPQYVLGTDFASELGAHLEDVTAHGSSLGLSREVVSIEVPQGYRYITFKILEISDTLTLEGDAVIL